MDPKQTEGQNSGPAIPQGGFTFSNGATPSGTPPTGSAAPSNTLSTGANISRTMDDLNVNDRKSATSNSPFAKHHFDKVAPGTGDILINQSSGGIIASGPAEKKGLNRGRLIQFGLIFGGVALIALVVFTVVMVINNPNKGNSGGGGGSDTVVVTGDEKELFDSFLEKLIIGEVGENTYNASDGKKYPLTQVLDAVGKNGIASGNVFYGDRLINYDNSQNRIDYLNELSSIIASFSASYTGKNTEIVGQISYYYQDFASVMPVLEADLIGIYQGVGYDQAVVDMGNTYGYNDDRGINDYNAYSQAYALAILGLLHEAKTKLGCDITDSESVASCTGIPSAESYQNYLTTQNAYFTTAKQIKEDARLNALSAIGTIYSEYYDESGNTIDTEERDE